MQSSNSQDAVTSTVCEHEINHTNNNILEETNNNMIAAQEEKKDGDGKNFQQDYELPTTQIMQKPDTKIVDGNWVRYEVTVTFFASTIHETTQCECRFISQSIHRQ